MFIPFEYLIVLIGVPTIFFTFLGYKAGKGAAYSDVLAKAKLTELETLEKIKNNTLQDLMEMGMTSKTIKPQEIFDRGQQTIDAFNDAKKCREFVG